MSKQNHIFTKIRAGSQAEMLAEMLSGRSQKKNGRTISTIGELDRAGLALQIECTDCGANEVVKGRKMRDRFGGNTLLKDVRDPCAQCGCQAVSRMPVSAPRT